MTDVLYIYRTTLLGGSDRGRAQPLTFKQALSFNSENLKLVVVLPVV